MAIAAIVLHCGGCPEELEKALRAQPFTVDVRQARPDRLAATIESPSQSLPQVLKQAENMPGVWNLELVYVNYEDDLDDGGFMQAPPLDILRDRKK